MKSVGRYFPRGWIGSLVVIDIRQAFSICHLHSEGRSKLPLPRLNLLISSVGMLADSFYRGRQQFQVWSAFRTALLTSHWNRNSSRVTGFLVPYNNDTQWHAACHIASIWLSWLLRMSITQRQLYIPFRTAARRIARILNRHHRTFAVTPTGLSEVKILVKNDLQSTVVDIKLRALAKSFWFFHSVICSSS